MVKPKAKGSVKEPLKNDDILDQFLNVLRLARIPFNSESMKKARAALKDPFNPEIRDSMFRISHRILPEVVLIAINNIEDPDDVVRDLFQHTVAQIRADQHTDELYQAIYREDATLESVQKALDAVPLNAVTLLQLIGRTRKGEFSEIEKKLVRYCGGRKKGSASDKNKYLDDLVTRYPGLSAKAVIKLIQAEADKRGCPFEIDADGKSLVQANGETLTTHQITEMIYKARNRVKKKEDKEKSSK